MLLALLKTLISCPSATLLRITAPVLSFDDLLDSVNFEVDSTLELSTSQDGPRASVFQRHVICSII